MHRSRIVVVIAVGLLIVVAIFCSVSIAQDQAQALIEEARNGDLKQEGSS